MTDAALLALDITENREDAEVRRLADAIDLGSLSSVSAFGADVGRRTAEYADVLLDKARAADLDETGAKLNEVLATAQAFDLSAFDNRWARAPVVGGLFRAFAMSRQRAVARFASVQTQVDKLVASIESTGRRLAARAADLEAMHAGVTEEQRELDRHVRAGRLRLAESADEGREGARAVLDKRVADLAVLSHSAGQSLPMIRVMQANNLLLLDKFHTLQRLTVPAWKRAFLLALALHEQRDAVQLANGIDDATNFFLRRNAELLHTSAVETAKANQRLVVDVDTLREVHGQVLRTLAEVRQVHIQGAKDRVETLAELDRLRLEAAAEPARVGAPRTALAPA